MEGSHTVATGTSRITIIFLIAFAGLLVIGFYVARIAKAESALSSERTQTRRLLVAMKDLFSDLQDAETGQRGYLLTGDERYLAPYLQARSNFDGHLVQVTRLTA